jgi:hypothetical protein
MDVQDNINIMVPVRRSQRFVKGKGFFNAAVNRLFTNWFGSFWTVFEQT